MIIYFRSVKDKSSFTQPQSPNIQGTPLSSRSSAAESPYGIDYSPGSSVESSTLTPQLGGVKIGGRRGRPRKNPEPPSYDDFPAGGTAEEQQNWIKRKTSEHWRYKQSTGPDSAVYRKKESDRALSYYYRKKAEKDLGVGFLPDEVPDKNKELSRAR